MQIASSIHLFDPAFEMPFPRLRLGGELEYERPSHHTRNVGRFRTRTVKLLLNCA